MRYFLSPEPAAGAGGTAEVGVVVTGNPAGTVACGPPCPFLPISPGTTTLLRSLTWACRSRPRPTGRVGQLTSVDLLPVSAAVPTLMGLAALHADCPRGALAVESSVPKSSPLANYSSRCGSAGGGSGSLPHSTIPSRSKISIVRMSARFTSIALAPATRSLIRPVS